VLGLMLVFSLVLAGVFVTVAFGVTAISDSQESLSVQRAEKSLTEFDSDAALVALGNTDLQEVSVGELRGSDFETRTDAGWMMVTIDNRSTPTTTTLLNRSLGAVTFEGDDTVVAYQGGGVWRRSDNGSSMVSPPEFHFRNGTLTLPVVTVDGDSSLGNRVSVRHDETSKKYPDASANDENPLKNHLVKVTVKSDYYLGWGRYFEERTDGNVEYDHDRHRVNLTLLTPIQQRKITAASASLSASGTFNVSGNPLNECHGSPFTDSYNSSQPGTYCTQTPGEEGDLIYGRDIDISGGGGGSEFHGDLVSGRNVTVNNNIDVFGHINVTDTCIHPHPSKTCSDEIDPASGGAVNDISGVDRAAAIDFYVEDRVESINASNNNDGRIDSDRLDFSENPPSHTVVLDEGSYFLERIDLDTGAGREKLVLDTTGGPVTLAVRKGIDLGDNTEIEVLGDGTVRMFAEGAGSHPDFEMGKDAKVRNGDDDATQIRLYGTSDFSAVIGGSGGGGNPAKYVGVIYAPPGAGGSGNVTLRKGAVYGGILTGTTKIPSSGRGTIHYDEALRREQIISPNARILKITYLHVSINRIRVE